MIKINNLSYTYPGASNPTLRGIDLHIEKGDFLAVIGNNGCGKSTLCKTLNGLIPHYIVGDFEGMVEIDGNNTLNYDIGRLALKVGYVYQDFENQIVRPTVLDDASFACLNFAMTDYLERGGKALEMCGLAKRESDYIWQLSGGQKHLLALAGMTALSPEVLILDEPIAQLDPDHAYKIYDTLRELNQKYNKTIIVIEHHTDIIAQYCKNVILMQEGKIVWKLPSKEALSRVEELEASNIFPPQVTVAAHQLRKYGRIADTVELPTTLSDGVRIFQTLQFKESKKQVNYMNKNLEPMITFHETSVEYRSVKGDNKKIFDDFSLDIIKGEKIALIGTNGAGKSTLLKMMVGLMKPLSGTVTVKGLDTKKVSPEQLSSIISLVYQNPEEMFIKDSIKADIEFAMKVRQVEDYEKRAKELMELFHLSELENRDGRLLSGGQMRRASLAIGIALNPSILLLDEPTANLDIATRKEIMKTLNSMKEITETVIIATHDMQLVCEWADRIIVLSGGSIIADGDRNTVFTDKEVTELVGIRPPEIFRLSQMLDRRAYCYTVQEFLQSFHKEEYEYDGKAV